MRGCKYLEWKRERKVFAEEMGEGQKIGEEMGEKIGEEMGEKMGEKMGGKMGEEWSQIRDPWLWGGHLSGPSLKLTISAMKCSPLCALSTCNV
jgi:hypothetical protein